MWKYITIGLLFLTVILVTSSTELNLIDEYYEPSNIQDVVVQDLVNGDEGEPTPTPSVAVASTENVSTTQLYSVVRVVDGDTIDVIIDGKTERLRLIGINTPETVDPRKPVECFGREASNRAKELFDSKSVSLESDSSQGERDKYGRLLRYVFLENGSNFNLKMIEEGYAYEYTYDGPYKYQQEFKLAQKKAETDKSGLWGASCAGQTCTDCTNTEPASPTSNSCNIKGNINAKKEKIFHSPGCGSYNNTVIDESAGEKWFCSEQEALNAGWRKALNC